MVGSGILGEQGLRTESLVEMLAGANDEGEQSLDVGQGGAEVDDADAEAEFSCDDGVGKVGFAALLDFGEDGGVELV